MQLPAEITAANAQACLHLLLQAQKSQGIAVVADASSLERFDSSALAVLLACRREAQLSGASFSVRGLPTRLRSLAALYGVAEILPTAS